MRKIIGIVLIGWTLGTVGADPRPLRDDVQVRHLLDVEAANVSGEERIATSADHKLNDTQGFDIAADGTFYIGGNSGNTVINVVRGVRDGDTIEWATVVRTERIPPGTKNHPHPAIVLSPDDRFVYINSGSRTDHGELAEDGAFAGARELPLSSAILRVPANGEDLLIPAAEEALLRRIVRRWGWSLM